MKNRFLCLICALGLAPVASIQAQVATTPLPEGLQQLRSLAQAHNPQLQAQGYQVSANQAQLERSQRRLQPHVQLKGELSYAWMKQDFARSANQLTASYPLYDPQLSSQTQVATKGLAQAQAQQQAQTQQILWQLSNTYVDWLKQKEEVRYIDNELGELGQILAQLKQRYQLGLVQLNDIAVVQSRMATLQAQKAQRGQRVSEMRYQLQRLVGQFQNDALTQWAQMATPERLTLWQKRAQDFVKNCQNAQNTPSCQPNLSQHPLILALDQEIARQKARQAEQKAQFAPKVQVIASYVYNDSGQHFYDDMQGSKVGVQWQVPLYVAGESESAVSAVRFQRQKLLALKQDALLQLKMQYQTAWQGIRSVVDQMQQFAQAEQAARQALKATQAGLKTGERNILDVLNAQRDLHQAQKNRHQALYELWRYMASLKYLQAGMK